MNSLNECIDPLQINKTNAIYKEEKDMYETNASETACHTSLTTHLTATTSATTNLTIPTTPLITPTPTTPTTPTTTSTSSTTTSTYSILEVDADSNSSYCTHLLSFSSFFTQTALHLSSCHLFFLLTINDQHGCHLVGFFVRVGCNLQFVFTFLITPFNTIVISIVDCFHILCY